MSVLDEGNRVRNIDRMIVRGKIEVIEWKHILMGCGGRPNHRRHYLERVSAATSLDITMTYF